MTAFDTEAYRDRHHWYCLFCGTYSRVVGTTEPIDHDALPEEVTAEGPMSRDEATALGEKLVKVRQQQEEAVRAAVLIAVPN